MKLKTTIYDALSVRAYKDSQGNEKVDYQRIGVAFGLKNKNGFSLKLTSLPVSGELVVIERIPKKEQKNDTEEMPF